MSGRMPVEAKIGSKEAYSSSKGVFCGRAAVCMVRAVKACLLMKTISRAVSARAACSVMGTACMERRLVRVAGSICLGVCMREDSKGRSSSAAAAACCSRKRSRSRAAEEDWA